MKAIIFLNANKRMDQGKVSLKKEEFPLEEMARDLISSLASFIAASNIKVELKAETGLPKIFADKYQIKLLIDNLINNAIRYTSHLSIERFLSPER